MKGLVTRIPRAAYLVVGGLLLLLLVAGSAYLAYTLERERRVEESTFRHLDAVGHGVEQAVRGYGDSLASLRGFLRQEWDYLRDADLPSAAAANYLRLDGCAKLALIPGLELVEPASCDLLRWEHLATLNSPLEVDLRRRGSELIFALDPAPSAAPEVLPEAAVPREAAAPEGAGTPGADAVPALPATRWPVRLRVDLHRVLGPDATRGLFSHLFLVHDGRVVLAQGPPGLRLARLQDPAELRPAPRRAVDDGADTPARPLGFARLAAASGSFDVELAGRRYRLLSHPLDLDFLEGSPQASPGTPDGTAAGDGATGRWVLCGLVPSGALRRNVLRVPPIWLLGLAAALVAAGLLFPFVRLATLGPRDRLPLGDVFRTGLALVAGSGLLALALHDAWTYQAMAARADRSLQGLGDAVQRSVAAEVDGAYRQLRRLERRLEDPVLTEADSRLGRRDGDRAQANLLLEPAFWRSWPPGPPGPSAPTLAAQPLFDDFMVVCPDGRQILKWTTRPTYTPFVDVADREYLRRVRHGDLWRRDGGGGEAAFLLQPVRSRTTGSLSTVMAAPARERTALPGGLRCFSGRPVVVLVMPLRSLTATVPPPGFGFAVVDAGGRVLFHSEPGRALVENLLRESGDDRSLRAAMAAGGVDVIQLDLQGRRLRARVEPMEGLPWTLVTFRDLEPTQRLNLRAVLDGAFLLTLFVLLFFALPGVYFLGFRRRLPQVLWPDFRLFRRDPTAYLRLAAVLLAVGVVELAAVALLQPGVATDLVFLLTPWVLLGGFVFLARGRRPGDRRVERRAALAAAGLLLLEAAVAPPSLRAGGGWLAVLLAVLAVVLTVVLTRPWRWRRMQRWAQRRMPRWAQHRVQRRARPRSRPRSVAPTRRLYEWSWIGAALAALVTLAVVPAVVFFCSAFRLEAAAAVADAQLTTVRRTEAWADELAARLPPADERPAGLLQAAIGGRAGLYAGLHHETGIAGRLAGKDLPPEPGAAVAEPRGCPPVPLREGTLSAVLYTHLFRFEELRGGGEPVADPLLERSPRGRFRSRFCADGRVYTAAGSLGGHHRLELLSRRPAMTGALLPAVPLLLAALLVPAFLAVRLVGRKVFLLAVPTLPSPQAAELRRLLRHDHLFLVGALSDDECDALATPPPRRTTFEALLKQEGAAVAETVERLLPGRGERGGERGGERAGVGDRPAGTGSRLVLLSGFADRVEDPGFNARKLDLLQRLLHRAAGVGGRLLVVSEVDPRTVPPEIPGDDDAVQWDAVLSAFTFRVRAVVPGEGRYLRHLVRLDRWRRAVGSGRGRRHGGGGAPSHGDLSARGRALYDECHGDEELRRIGLQLARQPEERLTESEVVPAVLELAEGHYRTLWDGCSEEERAVLVQVAEEGVVNPRREWTVHGLLRRRLLTRDPALRPMNRSFARFVRTACSRDDVARWEGREGTGAGVAVGGLLTAALVLVALFLFLTQPELFDLSLAFVSAVALAIPALLRLVGGMGRGEMGE